MQHNESDVFRALECSIRIGVHAVLIGSSHGVKVNWVKVEECNAKERWSVEWLDRQ